MIYLKIINVYGREVLDSRGNPTVEAQVTVSNTEDHRTYEAYASVPSGASTGTFEAVELRDGDPRYFGLGVQHAVKNINEKIAPLLLGRNAVNQAAIDMAMVAEDGTENKNNLGANAVLAVSLATAKAAAKALHMPLYRYLGGVQGMELPIPMMNILNGGKHAANTVDFQEFMILPVKVFEFSERLRICAEIYHNLKNILKDRNLSTGVGDEGGFAPDLPDAEAALDLLMEAVKASGYQPGEEIQFALDVAASELYDKENKTYYFPGESQIKGKPVYRNRREMIEYYEYLLEKYPIYSIEDGLAEEDWEGWQMMTRTLGKKVQLVGDDLFVTNTKRVMAGIKLNAGNAVLVKVNQIGSLTESIKTVALAKRNGFGTIISHRSGETEDSSIADLAVALNAGYIKTGAPCRGERTAKYNRLLRIEEEMR